MSKGDGGALSHSRRLCRRSNSLRCRRRTHRRETPPGRGGQNPRAESAQDFQPRQPPGVIAAAAVSATRRGRDPSRWRAGLQVAVVMRSFRSAGIDEEFAAMARAGCLLSSRRQGGLPAASTAVSAALISSIGSGARPAATSFRRQLGLPGVITGAGGDDCRHPGLACTPRSRSLMVAHSPLVYDLVDVVDEQDGAAPAAELV